MLLHFNPTLVLFKRPQALLSFRRVRDFNPTLVLFKLRASKGDILQVALFQSYTSSIQTLHFDTLNNITGIFQSYTSSIQTMEFPCHVCTAH